LPQNPPPNCHCTGLHQPAYDDRLRLTKWDVTGVLGYNYTYKNTFFNELTGRVSYAQNIYDSTLDRSYEYPWNIMDGPYSQG
jgi:hypothetical protein